MTRKGRPSKLKLEVGVTVGNLTDLKQLKERHKNGAIMWRLQCSCGNIIEKPSVYISSGDTRSCGCLKRKQLGDRRRVHGHSSKVDVSLTYNSWRAMRDRCKPQGVYAKKGIKVCKRWNNIETGYKNFLADMGERPSSLHSIDRIDNSGNYTPGNCRWAISKQQNRNRVDNIYILYKGRHVSIWDLAEKLKIPSGLVASRIYTGYPKESWLKPKPYWNPKKYQNYYVIIKNQRINVHRAAVIYDCHPDDIIRKYKLVS